MFLKKKEQPAVGCSLLGGLSASLLRLLQDALSLSTSCLIGVDVVVIHQVVQHTVGGVDSLLHLLVLLAALLGRLLGSVGERGRRGRFSISLFLSSLLGQCLLASLIGFHLFLAFRAEGIWMS